MQGLVHSMKITREFALLGHYEQALVYYDGVLCQIQQYLKTVKDSQELMKWNQVKKILHEEIALVKEISSELALFKVYK